MSQSTLGSTPYRNSDLFSGYYLQERVDDLDAWDCDDEAEAVFEELRDRWRAEGELLAGYNEDTLLGSWIDPVLDTLGYDTIQETSLPDTGGYIDRVLYDDAADRRDAMAMKQDGQLSGALGRASALLEAKQWDTDFTQRFSEQRSYRDASHQVKYYLEHTPESLQWGILTDGKKWRLYGTKDYATETYYEVDLPEILESGDLQQFKYFYLFFRPEAFREVGGSTFLETVWSESETAAQELGEDLQDNVFTALRVLGEGFVETNDLEIDPDDEAALAELKEQSLVLLYRLMFVLYAESRHLIDPEEPEDRAEFRENFSLDEIRLDIHERVESGETFEEAYSEYSHSIWGQLQDLFRLVDAGEESLGVSAYNGGLFDREQHEFLAEHEVSDRYIAEVIYRLGTTETADGAFALADYADLDTRHLGTIYEGLLEHEFRIAPEEYAAVAADGGQVWKPATEVSVADAVEDVEKGELYVVNDEGERKATGAYYTPDYVVSYIVEETIDPLLEEIRSELRADGLEPSDQAYFGRFYSEVQDLKVLDPAMGSGHFLTKATGYLTEQVMEVVREQEKQGRDEQHIRRTISRECIYGVDVNGMATELAKLSMWLETLAPDEPLAFLDHHLKSGNSLVGSDISEVLGTDEPSGTEQATLFDDFSRTRRQALEHVMDLVEDLLDIENRTVAQAKRMEDLYEEIREDDLYERLFGMANVHTAERFDLDVPDGAYKQMANAIDDADAWAEIQGEDWYTTAQAMAAEEQFFHWELEYPEVFFSADGERAEGAGFDAVVGNPPYISAWNRDLQKNHYYRTQYPSASGHYDLYCLFIEVGTDLLRKSGNISMIIPDTFCGQSYAENARQILTSRNSLRKVVDLREKDVFKGVSVENVVFSATSGADLESETKIATPKGGSKDEFEVRYSIPYEMFSEENEYRIPLSEEALNIGIRRKVKSGTKLDNLFYVSKGMEVHTDDGRGKYEFVEKEHTSENLKPYIEGKHIQRWLINSNWWVDYSPEEHRRPVFPELFESQKIVGARTIGDGRPMFAVDSNGYYDNEKVLNAVPHHKLESLSEDFTQIQTDTEMLEESKKVSTYAVTCILNSSLTAFTFRRIESGGLDFFPRHLRRIHIPVPDEGPNYTDSSQFTVPDHPIPASLSPGELYSSLHQLGQSVGDYFAKKSQFNLSLPDHLGAYDDGQTLSEIGLTQPPKGAADSILQQTAEEKPNLRVGVADVVRESSSTVEIRLTARYKPEDDDFETDQWGYTETEPLPALRITDLTETEADLIEAFVPVAVDEAGGFAGFRETATKTNSLVDRLRGLTLPRVADVEAGLESYVETKERADELDEKIQRTDDLIDEIVYELYGLTDEEIEIVEESVQ